MKKIESGNQTKKQEGGKASGINYPRLKNKKKKSKTIADRGFREISEMAGIGANYQKNTKPTRMKRCWGMLRPGGGADHHRRFRMGS